MSDSAILARPTDAGGFEGRIVTDDSQPQDLIPQLLALHETFAGDHTALAVLLIDEPDARPLLDQDTAHRSGARLLYLLEAGGVAVFETAHHADGAAAWTWRSSTPWTAHSSRAVTPS